MSRDRTARQLELLRVFAAAAERKHAGAGEYGDAAPPAGWEAAAALGEVSQIETLAERTRDSLLVEARSAGRSWPELAATMGTTPEHVEVLHFQARRRVENADTYSGSATATVQARNPPDGSGGEPLQSWSR